MDRSMLVSPRVGRARQNTLAAKYISASESTVGILLRERILISPSAHSGCAVLSVSQSENAAPARREFVSYPIIAYLPESVLAVPSEQTIFELL